MQINPLFTIVSTPISFQNYSKIHLHLHTGYACILQGNRDKISFTCPNTIAKVVDVSSNLWVLLDRIDPSLIISIQSLRERTENAKLRSYNNDVGEMLSNIREIFKKC